MLSERMWRGSAQFSGNTKLFAEWIYEAAQLEATIDALIAVYDLTQRDVENALKKWAEEPEMKHEELWTAIDYWNDLQKGDLEVETYIRVGDELAEYAALLEAKLTAIECGECELTMLE